MQTDRELLELAAKAEGHAVEFDAVSGLSWFENKYTGLMWNPLHVDGDALRLAVNLNLCPKRFGDLIEVVAPKGNSFAIVCEQGVVGGDLIVAYRRAIVRAAAALGAVL